MPWVGVDVELEAGLQADQRDLALDGELAGAGLDQRLAEGDAEQGAVEGALQVGGVGHLVEGVGQCLTGADGLEPFGLGGGVVVRQQHGGEAGHVQLHAGGLGHPAEVLGHVGDPPGDLEGVLGHLEVERSEEADRVGEQLGQQEPAVEQDPAVGEQVVVVLLALDRDARGVDGRVGVLVELLHVGVEECLVARSDDQAGHLAHLEVEPPQPATQLDGPVAAHRVDGGQPGSSEQALDDPADRQLDGHAEVVLDAERHQPAEGSADEGDDPVAELHPDVADARVEAEARDRPWR